MPAFLHLFIAFIIAATISFDYCIACFLSLMPSIPVAITEFHVIFFLLRLLMIYAFTLSLISLMSVSLLSHCFFAVFSAMLPLRR